MAQRVEVVGYRPEWERLYQTESGILRDILQGQLISVHHIGSTAVPGLAAKPVIDILAVVKEIGAVDAYSARLRPKGTNAWGNLGSPAGGISAREGIGAPTRSICLPRGAGRRSSGILPCGITCVRILPKRRRMGR